MTDISTPSTSRPGSKWVAPALLVIAVPAAIAVAIGLATAVGVWVFAHAEHAHPAATARGFDLLLHWLGR